MRSSYFRRNVRSDGPVPNRCRQVRGLQIILISKLRSQALFISCRLCGPLNASVSAARMVVNVRVRSFSPQRSQPSVDLGIFDPAMTQLTPDVWTRTRVSPVGDITFYSHRSDFGMIHAQLRCHPRPSTYGDFVFHTQISCRANQCRFAMASQCYNGLAPVQFFARRA